VNKLREEDKANICVVCRDNKMLKSNFVHSSCKRSSKYITLRDHIGAGVVILNLKPSEPQVYISFEGYDASQRQTFHQIEKTVILTDLYHYYSTYGGSSSNQEDCKGRYANNQGYDQTDESHEYYTMTQHHSNGNYASKYTAKPGYGFLLKSNANVNAWWTIESVESLKSLETDLMLACSCDNYSDCIAVWGKLKKLSCYDTVLIHQVSDVDLLNSQTSHLSRDINLTVRLCPLDPVEFFRKLAKKAKIELEEVEVKDNSESNEDSKVLLKTSDDKLIQLLR
jgi:hypothetical protein